MSSMATSRGSCCTGVIHVPTTGATGANSTRCFCTARAAFDNATASRAACLVPARLITLVAACQTGRQLRGEVWNLTTITQQTPAFQGVVAPPDVGKYTIEYTYSKKDTKDQILLVALPSVVSFAQQWQNTGALESNTHEVSLGAQLINSRSVAWQINVVGDRTRQIALLRLIGASARAVKLTASSRPTPDDTSTAAAAYCPTAAPPDSP